MPDRTPAGEVTGEVLREMREQCRVAAFGTFPAARRISVPHERILALLDAFEAQLADAQRERERLIEALRPFAEADQMLTDLGMSQSLLGAATGRARELLTELGALVTDKEASSDD